MIHPMYSLWKYSSTEVLKSEKMEKIHCHAYLQLEPFRWTVHVTQCFEGRKKKRKKQHTWRLLEPLESMKQNTKWRRESEGWAEARCALARVNPLLAELSPSELAYYSELELAYVAIE